MGMKKTITITNLVLLRTILAMRMWLMATLMYIGGSMTTVVML